MIRTILVLWFYYSLIDKKEGKIYIIPINIVGIYSIRMGGRIPKMRCSAIFTQKIGSNSYAE